MKSIYTFNAVTSLCFIAEWEGYIVTGSGEGVVHVSVCRSVRCVDASMCENVYIHIAMSQYIGACVWMGISV